jgi:arylsulfatase A-like enzyme
LLLRIAGIHISFTFGVLMRIQALLGFAIAFLHGSSSAGSVKVVESKRSASQRIQASALSTSGAEGVDRPNIVMILVDDLDEVITPYLEVMPNLKNLIVSRGVKFSNTFAPAPVCCPARAGILTGLYPHNNGVWTNFGTLGAWPAFKNPVNADGTSMNLDNEDRTIAVKLQKAGYRTAIMGKYFNQTDEAHVAPGWNEWYVGHDTFYGGYGYSLTEYRDDMDPNPGDEVRTAKIVSYGFKESDYSTDVLTNKAVDFIERADHQDHVPFFMYVTPTAATSTPLVASI